MKLRAVGRISFTNALFLGLTLVLAGCQGSGDGSGTDSSSSTAAYRWEVSLATSQQPACFQPNSSLPLVVAVYTKSGNPIPNPRYEVTSNVPDAIGPGSAGGWTVRGEGATLITVTYTGVTDPDATISPITLDVLRDGTPPQIAISQPARGAMVIATGDVRVQGEARDDTSPIQSLTVNGVAQANAAGLSQMIDVTPPGRWGLNVIEVVATDSCGNSATHLQSFLRSNEYRPAATGANTAARVSRGQTLKLTQEAVDDHDRADMDDIATLLERYLERNLGNSLAQNTSGQVIASKAPGCPGVGYRLSVAAPGATATGPHVRELALQTGSMRENLSLERLTVPLKYEQLWRIGFPRWGCTPGSRSLSASISASIASDSTSMAGVAANGQIGVTIPSVTVQVSDVRLVLTGNSAVDGVLSSLLGLMTNYMESAIENMIRSELPPAIAQVLNTPLTPSATIGSGPFGITLGAVAGIDGIDFVPAETTETAYTQVYPASTGTPYPALGAIARPTTAANLAANPGPMTYAIDDNLTNLGLWSLWRGGAMEIPDMIGYPGMALRVSALLPPVLMPGAQAGEVVFGVGDLKVVLNLTQMPGSPPPILGPVQVEAYVSYVLDGTVAYDGVTRDLHLQATPDSRRIYVQFTRISDGIEDVTDPGTRAAIETYAERVISRSIEQLADATLVSTVLPPLRFQFNEPAAGGTVDALEMEVTALARTTDHIVIDLRLKAEEPPNAQLDGYLTLNNPWTEQDLIDRKIPSKYWDTTIRHTDPEVESTHTITVFDYRRTTRPLCDTAGEYNGKPKCLPQWKLPLDYGWYCGAGRPLVGFTQDNPVLDPVDYCCVLHDRQIWAKVPDPKSDPIGFADAQARDACGVVMCMSQATGFPADITRRLPDVERARRQMYNMASIACGPDVQPEIPAPRIVPP